MKNYYEEHFPPILETQDPQSTVPQLTRQLTESFINLDFPFDGGILHSPPSSSPKSCFPYRVDEFQDDNDDKPSIISKPKLIRQDDEPCMPTHISLPPRTLTQAYARYKIDKLHQGIRDPHCKICGDTEKNDSKILKIPSQIGDIYLCEFCYNFQSNM